MSIIPRIFILAVLILISQISCILSEELPKNFPFNEENALQEWEEKVFKNKVIYEVVPKEPDGYLSASSTDSCSGLIYKVKFHPKDFPMISWYWKIIKFPDKSKISENGGWIEKDDYAARVYVIFPSFIFTDTKSLEYIWDETLPEGTIMTSPYFKNIKLIVAETGKNNIDKWVFEEHNIYDDYTKAFGKEPTKKVGAISLMTDTDNTVSSAEAFYKDLKVGYGSSPVTGGKKANKAENFDTPEESPKKNGESDEQ